MRASILILSLALSACQVSGLGSVNITESVTGSVARICTEPDVPVLPGRTGRCGVGVRVQGSFIMQDIVAAGGADAFAIDTAGSNVGIPVDHTVNVTARNSAGTVTAQQSFSAIRLGSQIKFSNTAAVDSWLISNANGLASLDVDLGDFDVQDEIGENYVRLRPRLNSILVGSQSQSWFVPCGRVGAYEPCPEEF